MAPNYLPAMLPASILSNTSRTTTATTIPHLLYALTTTPRRTTPTHPQRRNATSTSKTTRTASRKLPSLPPRSPPASKLAADPSSPSTSTTTSTTSRPLKPYLWAISLFGATTGLYLSYYISSLLLSSPSSSISNPQTTSSSHEIDITTRWADPTRDYDEEIEFSEKAMFMGRKRRRLLTENVVEGKVLEVSCGTGRNFEWYDFESSGSSHHHQEEKGNGNGKERKKKRGIESLTFNDQSEVMLKKARGKWEGLQAQRLKKAAGTKGGTSGVFTGPVKGIVGDAGVRGVIPRPEGGFDTIVQTMGVCSMRDPVAFLREMRYLVRQPGEGVVERSEVLGEKRDVGNRGKGEKGEVEEKDRGGRILLLEHGRGHYDWINRLLDWGAVGHAKRYGCWFNKDVGEVVRESGLVVERVRRYHLGTTWEVVLRPGEGGGDRGDGGGGGNKGDGKAWRRWW